MSEGILQMKRVDRDRLKVIHEVRQGHLSQKEAGDQLGISERQVRRVQRRVEKEGDTGVLHRGRGKRSNRRLKPEEEAGIQEHLQDPMWVDFRPTYAQEELWKLGYRVGRETVRKMQLELGLRKPRRRKEKHRERRERRACFGELVQMDTSEHDWLEGRGDDLVLIAMIDDANSRLRGRFFKSDNTLSNLEMIRSWVEEFGRPVALYVDRASHFKVNRSRSLEEDLSDRDPETQIQRAMSELGVGVIWANSPQAKGRVERLFGTLQDRLVKGMRQAGMRTVEEANQYLEEVFLPEWEERWTVRPKRKVNAHRRVSRREMDLDAIFSVREERTVNNDYTIRWNRRVFQITLQNHPPGLRGGKVEVEKRLDGSLALRFKGTYLEFMESEGRPSKRRRPAPVHPAASRILNAGNIATTPE
jgi:transposase